MQRLEQFESSASKPSLMHLSAGSCIRVIAGKLWLTVEGQLEDIWIPAGSQWNSPVDQRVWLSGEPTARFELQRPHVYAARPVALLRGARGKCAKFAIDSI